MNKAVAAVLLVLALVAAPAHAQTSLRVRPAWGNKDRAARWNAFLVRVSDPVPRNATLQLLSPEAGGFATVVEEHIAIGPTPATFEVVAPIHPGASQLMIAVLCDSASGKFLAQFPQNLVRPTPSVAAVGPHSLFVGITGVSAAIDQLTSALGAEFGFLPEHQLPRSAIGYDNLDVLVLNCPHLASVDLDQQRAILDWVRVGGSLLFTPGDQLPARDSPLATVLPCQIGNLKQVDLPSQTLTDLHLSARFVHISVRALDPAQGAEPLPLFKGAITGYSRRLGLGQILVLPFDIRTLEADDPADRPGVVATWQPILKALVRLPKPPTEMPRYAAPYNGVMSESPEQFREGAATATACDFLSPPGKASRNWPHVTLVLLGLFLIVGPVDCVVLKLTGQSPWTWTTMVGWIACFVLGGLYIASRVSKPPAVFATLRLIDQSDDATVATTDLLAVHLPGKTTVENSPAEAVRGWWEPVLSGAVALGVTTTEPDLVFHESDEGCVPLPVSPARDTRFFRRQDLLPTGPAIKTSLRLVGSGSGERISGTIQNLLSVPLKDVRLRTAAGVISVPLDASGVLAGGQTIQVDVAATGEAFAPSKFEGRYQNFGSWGSRSDAAPVREQDLWAVVPDMAARRSLKIDGLFEANAPFVCLYAESVNPAPSAKEDGTEDVALKSYEWVRVLIPLAR
jgi:hypothetical protein